MILHGGCTGLEFGVKGQVEARHAGRLVPLGGSRQRRLQSARILDVGVRLPMDEVREAPPPGVRDRLPPGDLRTELIDQLDSLVECRDEVAAAVGDPAAVHQALERLGAGRPAAAPVRGPGR